MKALVFNGHSDVSVNEVNKPYLTKPTDVILKITLTAICGSDLHLFDGYNPAMKKGDILRHEFSNFKGDISNLLPQFLFN